MAFDLRAPVPIRFQRYISNTPVWESGETYFAGDIVKYRVVGSALATDPTDTLYIALVNGGDNEARDPSTVGSLFWNAAAAGDVNLDDIIIPDTPLEAGKGQDFREAIGGDYVAQIAVIDAAQIVQDGLIAANLNADLGNVLATGYEVVPELAQNAFKAALAIQGSADAVSDGDIFLEGTALPATASPVSIGHIMVGGVIHPIRAEGDEVPAGLFAYNFTKDTYVQGSDDDGAAPTDVDAVLTITTADPHEITGVVASISAPDGFTATGTIVVAADGASATVTQSLTTATIQDYTWMITVSYNTGVDAQPDALRTEEVSVVAAPVAGGSFTFVPTTIVEGGPAGVLTGTIVYTGGFGSVATDITYPATQGFDVSGASTVGIVGFEAGTSRTGEAQFSQFTVTGITIASDVVTAGRSALASNANLYSSLDELDASTLVLTSNPISVTETPARALAYHGWTPMIYDGSGNGVADVTADNVLLASEFVLTLDSYALGQQIMTKVTPTVPASAVSYMIAIPTALGGAAAAAVINIGGQQVVSVTQMLNPVMLPAVTGQFTLTNYDVFLIKADLTYDALDRENVQTLIVE